MDVLKSLVVPVLVAFLTTLLINLLNRKKRRAELEKMNSEIDALKNRFQPMVISTLIKTHEILINDKINALRELLDFKEKLMHVDISYHDGIANVENIDGYLDAIYENICDSDIKNISTIIGKYGYLFRDKIVEKMNDLLSDLSRIYHIQQEKFSMRDRDMPDEAGSIVALLSKRFLDIIELIREDLHINDDFMHKFISNYKLITLDKSN